MSTKSAHRHNTRHVSQGRDAIYPLADKIHKLACFKVEAFAFDGDAILRLG